MLQDFEQVTGADFGFWIADFGLNGKNTDAQMMYGVINDSPRAVPCPKGATYLSPGRSPGYRSHTIFPKPQRGDIIRASATIHAAFVALACCIPSALALDATAVKTATEKVGNWLIEQYDPETTVFGRRTESDYVETVAVVIAALCNSPQDYKETDGPYISEPVKWMLSHLERGWLKRTHNAESASVACVKLAVESLKNEKYADLLKVLRKAKGATSALPSKPGGEKIRTESLVWAIYSVRNKHAAGMAEALMKSQRENGSFGKDIQYNAYALMVLTECYNVMRE